MDGWSVALWVVAGLVALSALVRLMVARRNRLVERFRAELAQENQRLAREERKKAQAGKKGKVA